MEKNISLGTHRSTFIVCLVWYKSFCCTLNKKISQVLHIFLHIIDEILTFDSCFGDTKQGAQKHMFLLINA